MSQSASVSSAAGGTSAVTGGQPGQASAAGKGGAPAGGAGSGAPPAGLTGSASAFLRTAASSAGRTSNTAPPGSENLGDPAADPGGEAGQDAEAGGEAGEGAPGGAPEGGAGGEAEAAAGEGGGGETEEGGEGEPGGAGAADASLDVFSKSFGLNRAQVTTQHRDAIVSDVQTVLAEAKGGNGAQPPASSPPGAAGPGKPAGGPQAPAAPQGQAGQPPAKPGDPASAPAASPPGSELPALLTEQSLKALDEGYGPEVADLGKTVNSLISTITAERAQRAQPAPVSEEVSTLRTQLNALHGEVLWTTHVQPVVSKFCEGQVKAGLPAIPPEKQREFANDAALYLGAKNPDGKDQKWTPERAMQAVYLSWTGEELAAKAKTARAEGAKEVVGTLRRRTRLRDVAGGPGSLAGKPRGADPERSMLGAAAGYLRGGQQR